MTSPARNASLKSFRHGRDLFLVYLTNHLVSRVLFSSLRLFWYRRVMKFVIGEGSSVLTDFKVSRRGNLVIGRHTVVNNSCRFDNRAPIVLGDNVSVTYGTMILTKGHDIDDPEFGTRKGPVRVDDYVWICANALLQPGVTVGKGAVVLSGSVVVKDVAPFHVVGGNPAEFVRERSRDLKYTLSWDPWVPFFG
jgi:acetyltransferase-like isoleucine patch superfamily enzyme